MEILEWTNFPFLGARKINVHAVGTSNRCAVMYTGRTAISLLTGQNQRFIARHSLGRLLNILQLADTVLFPSELQHPRQLLSLSGQGGCQLNPLTPLLAACTGDSTELCP